MFIIELIILTLVAVLGVVLFKKKRVVPAVITLIFGVLFIAFTIGLPFIFIMLGVPFGPGVYDFSYKVAGNYVLERTSAHQVFVVPQDGWSNETPIIPTKVVEIAWNHQFVIAKQQGLKRCYPDNPENTYEMPDENVFNYWILDTKQPKAYGPLDKQRFETMRKSLFVPDELVLKSVDSYRKMAVEGERS